MNDIRLKKLQAHVADFLKDEGSGHGFDHILRVLQNAMLISKSENADTNLVAAAALLHDIGDYKLNKERKEQYRKMIPEICEGLGYTNEFLEKVIFIVERVSYKGAAVEDMEMPIEGKIVRDADRLDAIGAIGIARAFAYGGSHHRKLFNPEEDPELHNDFEKYKNANSSTLNHFYEKLFLLKDRMETETAKKIAEDRHAFMEEFVRRFKEEWNGEL
jgi:uncharacterized protein